MTRSAFFWQFPAFAHVFYKMMADGKDRAIFTKDVPIAATDGDFIMLNPDTFFNYSLPKRLFALAHEVLHGIFDHCGMMHQFNRTGKVAYEDGTSLDWNPMLGNIAADYVINDILVAAGAEIDKGWLHDTTIATKNDSYLDAYRKLYKEMKGKGGGSGGNGRNGQQGFDEHLAPGSGKGQDPVTATQSRNHQQWATEVAAGIEAAKLQGKLPAGLERLFGALLEPKVDWREHLQSCFARRLGGGGTDWRRPDRRLIVRDIYAPGRSGFGTGVVVVGADTSGSIDHKTLDMFLAEVAGLLDDCKPKALWIMWCDAAVHRVDECEEANDLNTIRAEGVGGGGGTSFIPVFEKIEELGITPEALVYLTDGYGSFPSHPPSYPVIWGNISPEVKYPFGDVVDIPKQV